MYPISQLLDDCGLSCRRFIYATEKPVGRFMTCENTQQEDCLILSQADFQKYVSNKMFPLAGSYIILSDELSADANLTDIAKKFQKNLYLLTTDKTPEELAKLLTQTSTALFERQNNLLAKEYQALVRLLSKEAAIDEITAYAYKLLGNPLIITDESYKVLAHTKELAVKDPVWESIVSHTYSTAKLVEQTDTNRFWERLEISSSPLFVDDAAFEGLARRAVAKIRIGSQTRGYIALLEIKKHITALDLTILQMIAEVFSVKINETDNMLRATGQLRDEFTGNLLAGNITSLEMAENLASSLSLRFGEINCVLCVQAKNNHDYIGGDLACLRTKLLTKSCLSIYTYKSSQGYYILSFKDRHQLNLLLDKHLKNLLQEFNLIGIISLPIENILELQHGYEQVEQIRLLLPKIEEPKRVLYPYASFAAVELLSHLSEARQGITSRAYTTLLKADEEEGTEYLATMRAFFANNQNVSETAAKLFIHRNTVNYRLNRIRELLEDDFDDSLIRLHLQLSILANDLK